MTRAKARHDSLKDALNTHRREAEAAIRDRIHHARAEGARGVSELLEQTDANNQRDLEFALAQMRGETLDRINEALGRLAAGQYGSCVECEDEISESRLRALPFAVRCLDCAERHEQRSQGSRAPATSGFERLSPFDPIAMP